MKTYMYPENLKAKASLWLWELKDMVILGTALILTVFLFVQFGTLAPFCLAALYAFLSMRFDDTSLMDYITYATRYFISSQQIFYWRLNEEYSEAV